MDKREVQGSKFKVQSSRFKVQSSKLKVQSQKPKAKSQKPKAKSQKPETFFLIENWELKIETWKNSSFVCQKKVEKPVCDKCSGHSGRRRPGYRRHDVPSRKYCADASLGIKNDNTFARKGFFLRYISLENKQAKLESIKKERTRTDPLFSFKFQVSSSTH